MDDGSPRSLAVRVGLTWSLGVVALAALAIGLARSGESERLDLQLRAHALAVYGLAWFDERGRFHDEVLLREDELLASDIDVFVLSTQRVVFRPPSPRVVPSELRAVAGRALATEEEVWARGVADAEPYRLLVLPTWDDADRLAGAVVAVADPRPGHAAWRRFAILLSLASVGFMAGGVAVSGRLARRLHARQLAAVAERQRFLDAAAHELRTPVATVLAVVESSRAGDEQAEQALERVGRVVGEASAMVERLVELSRLDTAELDAESVRLDLLVDTCLEEGEEADLEATVVVGDARLLQVAVRNLLHNARTHGGGVRRVRVGGEGFVVEDRGPGLSDEHDWRQPFVKGPASPGSGLGLAVVDRIAALHGGRLVLGPGPRVTLELPVSRTPGGLR